VQRSYNEPVPDDPRLTKRARQRRETQARILAAARRVFASSGYERATIRAIAAAAEVNPGLVIHYFGSKQELFTQAARISISGSSGTGTKEHLVESLLESLGVKLEALPLEAVTMLRSMLTHPEAARDVRLAVSQQAEQVGAVIDADAPALRATLIESIMLGVVIGRHLLDLDALRDAEPGQIAGLLRPCFEVLAREHRTAPMLQAGTDS
jgi:AcrR family transcriptional regulator